VDSIQHSQDRPSTPENTFGSSVSVSQVDMSPNSRRKRDLAQALFGKEEPEEPDHSKSEGDIVQTSEQPPAPAATSADPVPTNSAASPSSTTPYLLTRNPSIPRVPHTPQEEAQLAREVQQKINAATLALKKPSANTNLATDPYGHSVSPSRRRISPNQISTPRLVSSTTSVEAVPIPRAPSLSSANNSGPSRIGSRFKKLRGTLRSKNPLPTGEEVTPFPLDPHSASAAQNAQYDSAKLKVSGGTVTAGATESRFKVSVPSPPASAGPGLKGFMARLRGKQRVAPDITSESDPRRSPLLSSSTTSTHQRVSPQPTLTPKPIQAVSSSSTLRASRQPRSAPAAQVSHESADPASPKESTALQQLFDAANNLGLDQGALNDLLARSPSTSSRTTEWTMLTRNNSTIAATPTSIIDSSRLTPTAGHPGIDNQSIRAETPDPKANERTNGRRNVDSPSPRDDSVSGPHVIRKPVGHLRRPREGQSDNRATSAIIRRTIIYPSESRASPIDLGAVTRKNSNRRKRASASSVSSRSVHDRAPTPPPPRSPTSKRFSNGPSPPVPNLPPSLTAQADNLLSVPSISAGGPIEKSNSTYDSL
jgi:serine/arginine repetitive matrix protein 2